MPRSPALEALFADETHIPMVWHSRPHSVLGLGRLAKVPQETRNSWANDVDTEAAHMMEEVDRTHWPSLAVSAGATVVLNAINVWVENDTVTRHDFKRTEWHWHPHCLAGTWRAGAMTINLAAAVTRRDAGLLQVRIRNTGTECFEGQLVFEGDQCDYNTRLRFDQKGDARVRWHDGQAVSVQKSPRIRYWPVVQWEGAWKEEDVEFDDFQRACQFAFAFKLQGGTAEVVASAVDGLPTWRTSFPVGIDAGGTVATTIGFAGDAIGDAPLEAGAARRAAWRARDIVATADFSAALDDNRRHWMRFFDRVPVLRSDWPEDFLDAYYRAWATVFFNIAPPFDLGFGYRPEHTLMMCNKVSTSGFTVPASWEASLGALLLCLTHPATSVEIMKSIYDAIQEDGFIAEQIGRMRNTALANVEPFVTWAAYKESGDIDFLRDYFTRIRSNFVYKTFHPCWRHMTVFTCRNMMYNVISGHFFLRICRELNRPAREIRKYERLIRETYKSVNGFWDDDVGAYRVSWNPATRQYDSTYSADSLIGLFRAAKPERIGPMLELLRREYLTESGALLYSPGNLSREAKFRKSLKWQHMALKPSNFVFLWKGLKDHDPGLFDHVLRGTVANIARAGDFYEEYDVLGRGWNNGPGSLFGAFGVIWGLLVAEGAVDHLFD